MDSKSFSNEIENNLTPEEFWDAYFSFHLLSFQRRQDNYEGVAKKEKPKPGVPILFRESEAISFSIPIKEIEKYKFNEDKRFSYIRYPDSFSDIFDKIDKNRYVFIRPAPLSQVKMSEYCTLLLESFKKDRISIDDAMLFLSNSYRTKIDKNILMSTVLIWIIGESRAKEATGVLINILESSISEKIHFEILNACYSAILRVNSKKHIPKLVDCLRKADKTAQAKIATLLGILLSANKLITYYSVGEKFYSYEYWFNVVENFSQYSENEWLQYDVKNVFWEYRYMVAVDINKGNLDTLKILADDEIPIVRKTAKMKINSIKG